MMNIILIGYRCSGKTVVGNYLAKKMNRSFMDTDIMLMKKCGRTVLEVVQAKGWDGFRKIESDVIREACSRSGKVIATGGGAVLDPQNVAVMKQSGGVVWLKATPETIQARMARDESTDSLRPALTAKGRYDEIAEVLKTRAPIYAAAMDFSIDTDDKSVIEITDAIMKEVFAVPRADSDAGSVLE